MLQRIQRSCTPLLSSSHRARTCHAAVAVAAHTHRTHSHILVMSQPAHSLSRHYAEPTTHAAMGMALPTGVQFAAAADRNKADIAEAIKSKWNDARRVLELSSGAGQHVSYFASVFPQAVFTPSDMGTDGFVSIQYHSRERHNVNPPIVIDLLNTDEAKNTLERSGLSHSCDVTLVSNMLHISAPGTTEGLFAVADAALTGGGRLFVYGPFKRDGQFTTESNAQFDTRLKQMNPQYGLRDTSEVAKAGAAAGFTLTDTRDMPANNFMLTFVKDAPATATSAPQAAL